ncbi:hypothetical protein H0H87_002508 [Tephrocybe sp. NHM501043]|nr:hypothetical protein H0H87_002508 [Tephrocybe sp. NHM501043]
MAEITKFEQNRAKLEEGLATLSAALKATADLTDTFAAFVKDATFTVTDGEKKARKRKGAVDDDDDDKPVKRKRKAKDPNAPKRPASSYIMFQNDIRKDLKEKNPHLSNPDLLALISAKWSEMSEADKAVYNQAVASAKEQYSKEKTAYDARSPEEVAAANAATEAAIAAKKAQPRARKSQAAATPATTAPAESSPSAASDTDDSDDSDEEEPPKKVIKAAAPVDEDSEEDSDGGSSSEEEPPKPPVKIAKKPKAAPAPAPVPAVSAKTTKKKATK